VAERYLARNARTAWRVYDGEAVILSAEDSTLNTLNPAGTLIWQGADGKTPVRAIVDRICAEFNVDPAQAESDLTAFIETLSQRGLLKVFTSPHEGP
jgi:hypothetical protein